MSEENKEAVSGNEQPVAETPETNTGVEDILNTAEEEKDTAAEEKAPEESVEEKLQRELKEWQDKYLYLQAEYQNYRKRVVKDIADARSYTVSDTLTPFLSVYDYLSMAGMAAEQSDNLESIRMGLKMIMGEFFKAFDELGVTKLESVGKKFNDIFRKFIRKLKHRKSKRSAIKRHDTLLLKAGKVQFSGSLDTQLQ